MRGFIKRHYHWVIAIVVLLQLSVYIGCINNYTSLHIVPVSESLQISRATFSLAVSTKQLIAFVSTLFSGFLFLKFGYKKLVLTGLALGAAGYFILSSAQGPSLLFFGAAIMGLLEFACSTAGSSKLITDWFYKHRGTILGFVSASTGIGGSLFCIVLNNLILQYGWRASYRFSAILTLLLWVVLFLTIRNRPADMGLTPYGMGYRPKKKARSHTAENRWLGFTPKEMLRRPTFYMMLLGTLGICVCMYMAFNVVSPHLQDKGLSSSEAATMQSIMLLFMAAAKFFCGVLSDRIGPKPVTMLCIAATVAGLVLLATANSVTTALIAVLVFACALPATTITIPLLTPNLFGYQSSTWATGIFLSMVSLSALFSSTLSNYFYDQIGSYSPIFIISALVAAGIAVLYLVMFVLAERDKKKYHIDELMDSEVS